MEVWNYFDWVVMDEVLLSARPVSKEGLTSALELEGTLVKGPSHKRPQFYNPKRSDCHSSGVKSGLASSSWHEDE